LAGLAGHLFRSVASRTFQPLLSLASGANLLHTSHEAIRQTPLGGQHSAVFASLFVGPLVDEAAALLLSCFQPTVELRLQARSRAEVLYGVRQRTFARGGRHRKGRGVAHGQADRELRCAGRAKGQLSGIEVAHEGR
jgi:hypothetical protein